MENLLPPHPLHLATLGLLDNEIGAATLGFIVGPPIAVRFPYDAQVQELAWLGWVNPEADWWATAQTRNWVSLLDSSIFDLNGILGPMAYKAVIESNDEFYSIIQQSDLVGDVEENNNLAIVQGNAMVSSVQETDGSATVQESVPLGVVVDAPGKGGCC